MLHWLQGLLYRSTPAEFVSSYGLSESVARLMAATKRSAFLSFGETSAVGKVSASYVRLERVIPMMRNSFKPVFVGQFEVRDGVTVLRGRFTLALLVKVFMTVWFGMLVLIGGEILAGRIVAQRPMSSFLVFQPLLMVAAGVLLVMFGKWLSRKDVIWLSSVIERALGAAAVGSTSATATPEEGVPAPLKAASLFLAACAVMQFAARFLPRTVPAGRSGALTALVDRWQVLLGFALLLLALAIWRRRPVGWWGGFVALGLGFIVPLGTMHQRLQNSPPIAFQAIFAVMALCVGVVWGLWWHAQRKHFASAAFSTQRPH